MAKIKFPLPSDCKRDNPAVICPGERVIGLYNQVATKKAQKISKKVRAWFAIEAINRGWIGVHFIKEVQTDFGAGCVLWLPAAVQIQSTHKTLVLIPQTEQFISLSFNLKINYN